MQDRKLDTDIKDDAVQIVVPRCMRLKLLEVAHDIPSASHCGIARTKAMFLTSFTWPNLNKSVKWHCKTCEICQKVAKSHKPKAARLQSLPVIDEPMKRISLDIVGPLNVCPDGLYKYILTAIDNSTHVPFAVPLRSHTAEDVAAALVHIFTQYRFPSEILTDNSQEFTSALHDAFWDVFKVDTLTYLLRWRRMVNMLATFDDLRSNLR